MVSARSANGTVVADAIGAAQAWASTGGPTPFESEPAYQLPFQSTGFRTTPDVAFDASENSGVTCFQNGSLTYGSFGTSLGSPCWAGLFAIVNQGRVANGGTTLNSTANPIQTLQALYSLPASDFNDITSGYTGFNAGTGYDLATGRGSPITNLLIPDLASYELPTQLETTAQPPATVTAGNSFTLTVTATDRLGDVITSYKGNVTIALANNPGAGTFGGNLTVAAVDGVAVFPGLTLDTAGSDYTIQATSGTLVVATSNDVDVSPAAAYKLVIHTQPSSTAIAGQTFATQPVIYEEDHFGNLETADNTTVVLAMFASGTGPLHGTPTATVSGGVATFTNLAIDTAETLSLKLTSSGLTTQTSNNIVVSPAPAYQLVIHTQPSSTSTAGQAFAAQPVIYEEDHFGNLETADNATVVSAMLASGAGPLQGTPTATVLGGVASFTNLADDIAEAISLKLTSPGLTSPTSNSIVVSPAAAYQLVIHTQPSATATAGQTFSTQPVIYEEDDFGNVETADSTTVVTASLASGAGPLKGMSAATVAHGVASFSNLSSDTAETLSLKLTSPGLTSLTSNSIVISPAAAYQLVIHTEPSATTTAGQAFATQPVIYEVDQFGNVETADNTTVVTAALGSGAGPLQGTQTATVAGGVASFTNLADDTAGSITLDFGSGSLTPATAAVTVMPLPVFHLVVATQPPNPVTSGQSFTLVVWAEDKFNTIDTNYNGSVSISVANDPSFTTTVQAKNGVATFSGLTVDASASGLAIQVSAPGVSGSTVTELLNVKSSVPPPPPPSAPTVVIEKLVETQKKNNKGKPIGKPVFSGFSLQYSAAMDASTAGLASNYHVFSEVVKKVKKKRVTTLKPVSFSLTYSESNNTVTINLKNVKPFATGGEITISGVTSQAGVLLNPSDTEFTVLAKAKGITLGG